MRTIHKPVMLEETLKYLNPKPGQTFIDCTFGGGGHSLALVERVLPDGKVIGIDLDPKAITESRNENLILINDSYVNLEKIVSSIKKDIGNIKISGILFDLGMSSDQLNDSDRGFSFDSDSKLDFRYNRQTQKISAVDILKKYSQYELAKIFKEYGEEPLANEIAKKIIAIRKEGIAVERADMLVRLVQDIYRRHFKNRSRKNPAARVFQALRIAVNDELGNIKKTLPQAIEVLHPGGRIVVISFHSLEDRLVKNFFKEMASFESPRIKIITTKPLIPTEREIDANQRSRSAKMRVVEKI